MIFLILGSCGHNFVQSLKIDYYQPRHVHLAYGESTLEIVVTWSTLNATEKSLVEFGPGDLTSSVEGVATRFEDGGAEKRFQFIHRVTLRDLQPNTNYRYHCGSPNGWSSLFEFRTNQLDANWSPRLAVYGDMGNENAQSMPRLQKETTMGLYDAVLHVGDFAYDMDSEDGLTGDEFMHQIEPIAAYLPYMTCAGNHEQKYNFSNYKARFSMPGHAQSLFYSFDLGPAHFVGVHSEVYYQVQYGLKLVVEQFVWLKEDLRKANENRQQRPWIITFAHRPMYCSTDDDDDCRNHETLIRVGLPLFNLFGLEDLFYKNGVDLEIWAHEHTYERLWPLYNYTVYNGSLEHPYTNPKAPVHIITGSAGCKEKTDNFVKDVPEWSAFRTSDYGYTRMKVHNATHLYLEQVSDDQDGKIIDSVWLIKDKHGRYDE